MDVYSTKTDNVSDVLAADINNPQDAIEALEAKVGVDSSAVTTSLDYKVNNFFATGRKVYLYENTAPTGWSITAVTDKVLAVKGGADAYNISGGTAGGTWTQPNHTHTYTDVVNHTHNIVLYETPGTGAQTVRATAYTAHTGDQSTDNPAGGVATGTTNNGATAATYRPYAAVGIICTKA